MKMTATLTAVTVMIVLSPLRLISETIGAGPVT